MRIPHSHADDALTHSKTSIERAWNDFTSTTNQPTIHIDRKLKAKGLCDTGCDYKLFYGKAISHDILMINLIKLQVYVWQHDYIENYT